MEDLGEKRNQGGNSSGGGSEKLARAELLAMLGPVSFIELANAGMTPDELIDMCEPNGGSLSRERMAELVEKVGVAGKKKEEPAEPAAAEPSPEENPLGGTSFPEGERGEDGASAENMMKMNDIEGIKTWRGLVGGTD